MSSNRNWMEFGPRLPYPHPIPIPLTDPTDNPQWYIHTSEPFIPYVNGAIKRLIEEETWERDDDGGRQNAILYFDELMSSWQIRPNIAEPDGYMRLNGDSSFFSPGNAGIVYSASSQPQKRIQTSYAKAIGGLGSSIFLEAWDTRSDANTALNLFDIRVIVPDLPTFPDDDLEYQWAILEDGGVQHTGTIANGHANKSTLGMPLFCTIEYCYFETDKYGIWWYLETGLMPDGN